MRWTYTTAFALSTILALRVLGTGPDIALNPDPECLKRLQWSREVVTRIASDGEFLPEARAILSLATFLDSEKGKKALSVVADAYEHASDTVSVSKWISERKGVPPLEAVEIVAREWETKGKPEIAHEVRSMAREMPFYFSIPGAQKKPFTEILTHLLQTRAEVSPEQVEFLVEGGPLPILRPNISVDRLITPQDIGKLYEKHKGIRGKMADLFFKLMKPSLPAKMQTETMPPANIWGLFFDGLHRHMKRLTLPWIPQSGIEGILYTMYGAEYCEQIAELYFDLLGIETATVVTADQLRDRYFRILFYDARALQAAIKEKQRPAPKVVVDPGLPGQPTQFRSYPLSTKLERHLERQAAKLAAERLREGNHGAAGVPVSVSTQTPLPVALTFNDDEALDFLSVHATSERVQKRLVKLWENLSADERKNLKLILFRIGRHQDGPGRFAGLVTKTQRDDLYEVFPMRGGKSRLYFIYAKNRVFFVWAGTLDFKAARKDALDASEAEWENFLNVLSKSE